MKNVAIVGTQGVPARYGGFETLVENMIGKNCPLEVQYTVFCSSKDFKKEERLLSYKGAFLKYIPLHANGMQSTPYDIWSLLKVIRGYDVIVVLGVSGCIFLPIFRLFCHKRLVINIDGLEHRRAKWGRFARRFLRLSEAMAVRYADVIVTDNKGIQDYVRDVYGKDSALIAYGGDHVKRTVDAEKQKMILDRYGLTEKEFSLSVCRIEPENNCHIALEAFAKSGDKLVFIGNWNKSAYGQELKQKYDGVGNILLLDSVYDLDVLYVLRSNCRFYIHGHSAGGTNPSLVEAMFFNCPILAYDVVYNRETTENKAFYFRDASQLLSLLMSDNTSLFDKSARDMSEIANRRYLWKVVSRQYLEQYDLVSVESDREIHLSQTDRMQESV